MDWGKFLASTLFATGAYFLYKYLIKWKKVKKEKILGMDYYDKNVRVVRIWGLIILFIFASIFFLYESF